MIPTYLRLLAEAIAITIFVAMVFVWLAVLPKLL